MAPSHGGPAPSPGRPLVTLLAVLVVALHAASVTASHVILVDSQDSGITCWTCPNKTDNEACNDWAPDRQCPTNHTVCKTVHHYNMVTRESISVYKTCTTETECTLDMIGCYDTASAGVQACVSCCNLDYCNEAVPTNHSSALALSTIPSMMGSEAMSLRAYRLLLSLTLFVVLYNSRTPVHRSVTRVT